MDLTRRWGRKTLDDCVLVGISVVESEFLLKDWLRLFSSLCEYEMADRNKTTMLQMNVVSQMESFQALTRACIALMHVEFKSHKNNKRENEHQKDNQSFWKSVPQLRTRHYFALSSSCDFCWIHRLFEIVDTDQHHRKTKSTCLSCIERCIFGVIHKNRELVIPWDPSTTKKYHQPRAKSNKWSILKIQLLIP